MDDKKRQMAFAAATALLLLGAVAALWLWPDKPEDTPGDETRKEVGANQLATWPAENAEELAVQWDAADGPRVSLDGKVVSLAPRDLEWSAVQTDSGTIIEGVQDDETSAMWQFTNGNPTALFTIKRSVPAMALDEPATLTLHLPPGGITAWSRQTGFETVRAHEVDGWQTRWLRWTGEDSTVTFRGWTGDSLSVNPTESGGSTLELTLWHPDHHPRVIECLGEMSDEPVILSGRIAVDFRALPKLTVWPFLDGATAMLLPVFIAPSLHSDPQLAEAQAQSADAFVDRVTTLAYGHSSTKDPRYGNGGLLGHGLGGTVVAAESLARAPAVQTLAETVAPTDVNIATAGASQADSAIDVRYGSELGCETLRDPALRGLLSPSTRTSDVDAWAAIGPFHPRVDLDVLDGRLDSLFAQGFSKAYADQALRDRGIYSFATPLVATRNPLIGAAADAILEPERNGQWTVNPRLAGSLADVELWREEKPLGVTSARKLFDYWQFRRDTVLSWTADGALVLSTSSLSETEDEAPKMNGFTLGVAEDVTLPKEMQPLPSMRTVRAGEQSVRLLYWDVASDTAELPLGADLSDHAIRWKISEISQ